MDLSDRELSETGRAFAAAAKASKTVEDMMTMRGKMKASRRIRCKDTGYSVRQVKPFL